MKKQFSNKARYLGLKLTAIIFALLLFASGQSWGQTPYVMSGGDYSEQFTNIAITTNWPNGFNGTDCAEWSSVGIIGTGTSVTSGVRTTKSSATFVTTTTGGIQRGSAALLFLSTGSTTTPEAVAVDLLLNFTSRNAGTLSFDWAAIDNSSGTRPTSIRVFWSTDGSTFTEITGAQVIDQVSPSTGSITNVSLPSAFNNSATARLRFYNHAGTITGSGNRDKIQIDNIAVTSTALSPTLSVGSLTGFGNQCINGVYGPNSFTISGTNLTTANVTVSSLTGYTFSTTSGGTYTSSLDLIQSGGTYSQDIYVKFSPTAVKSYDGNIVVGGGGASNVNRSVTGSGINTAPSISTPTSAGPTVNTATLGGNLTAIGCADVTERGIYWSTTNGFADGAGTKVSETPGPYSTGVFTESVSGLPSASTVYYKAFASSSAGTVYTSQSSFNTLSDEPSSHATSFTATSASQTQINLTFDAASTITNAAGYLILQKTGSAPTGAPSDATAYSTGNAIGDGTVAAIITNTADVSKSITGLSAGTHYYFKLFPYNGTSSTINYKTDGSVPAADASTDAALDATTIVEAPASQILAGNISSIANSNAAAIDVFKFKITDLATTDVMSTKVTQVKIKKSSGTADWTDHIAGAELWNGGTQITTGTPVITDADITFPITSGDLEVANNSSKELTLKIWLNTANLVDNATMVFTVSQTSHGFTADATGSTFAADFGTAVTGNTMTVAVVATKFHFSTQPSNTSVNTNFSVAVEALDANNIRDIDAVNSVTLSANIGTLSSALSGVTHNLSSGIYTWTDLQNNTAGTAVILSATGDLTVANSNSFTILSSEPTTAATSLVIGSFSTDNVQLSWTNGDGSKRIVVARLNATTRVSPADGTGYTANSSLFTDALNSTTGTGNVVVYNDNGSTVTVSGLTAGTAYAFDVYEYNGTDLITNYLTTTYLTGSKTTLNAEPTVQASAVNFTNVSSTGFSINWTKGSDADNSLVIIKDGSAVDASPVDGTSYTATATSPFGTQIGTGNYVVYRASLATIAITGLTDGHTYYVAVYSYKGTAGSGLENYLTTSPATGNVTAQTATYYSQASGDPATLSNWNTTRNGIGGSNPSSLTANAAYFVIQNTHNLTTTGTLTIGTTGSKLQIENGGTLTANHAVTIPSGATFQIDNGGTYVHNNTNSFGTTIFQGTESFASNSTVEFKDWNTTGPSVTAWGNVKFNATGAVAGSMQLSGNMSTINGNLEIIATGSTVREIRLTSGSDLTINIVGNLNITGGYLNLSSGTGVTTINLTGNMIVSSGTISETSTGSGKIVFNKTGTQTFTGGGTISNTVNFEVASTSILDLGTNIISGGGSFTLPAGATLKTANITGLNGSLTLTGTKTLNAGANYEFNGTADQTCGALLSSANNVSLANTTGKVSLSSNLALSGTLTVPTGNKLGVSSYVISGAGNVVLQSGSTFYTTHASGLNGNLTTTSKTIEAAVNYVFNGTTDQSMGALLTSANNINLANTTGKVSLSNDLTLTGTFTIPTSNKLDVASYVISGTGDIDLQGGATFLTAHASGINGNNTTSGGLSSYSNTANYTFNGSSAQVTGSLLPATVNNLTIDNAAGVTLSNAALTVNGTLLINSGKVFEVGVNKQLTVTGTLTNSAGNTGLVLKSDDTGTASLINSTAGVNATVERYIPKNNSWHFLSSPVASQTIIGYFAPSTCDQTFDFFKWDENVNMTTGQPWINLRATANSYNVGFETDFTVGKAYLVAYSSGYNGSENKFTGSLNSGDQTIAITKSLNTFNLIGNPFASAIDWDASGYTNRDNTILENAEPSIWSWNGTSGNYGTYKKNVTGTNGVTNVIAPHQGFFVQAKAAGSFTIPNTARVHSNSNILKSTPSDLLRLTVTTTANSYSDEIIVNFNSNSTANESVAKWFSMISTAPSLYSVKNAKNYTINTLAAINADLIVPVSFKAGVNGNYSIKASELASFSNLSNLILKDLQTGITQNLLQNPVYNFASSTTDNANRFQLIFNSTSGINNLSNNSSVIYLAENQIQIYSNNQIERLEIYNAIGQLVYQSNTKSNQLSVNVSDFTRGTYIVRLISNQKIQTQKLIINN